jgi:hypothetical protein
MLQVGQVITGVNKSYNKSSINIYPNPSAGIVTVEIPERMNNSEIRIISMIGVNQICRVRNFEAGAHNTFAIGE